MKVVKYLFAFWAGILIYASLSILFGPTGISAYQQLEQERNRQEENIASLKSINRELEDATNSLLYDRDTLAIYAREQGYAYPQERFIRIVGLGANQKIRTSAGDLVFAAEPQYTPDRTLRIISLCAGATIMLSMAFFDFLKFLRDRS